MCPAGYTSEAPESTSSFAGTGGTTLVAALLKENRLSFWCVGDSDLFLLRENKLYGLNTGRNLRTI